MQVYPGAFVPVPYLTFYVRASYFTFAVLSFATSPLRSYIDVHHKVHGDVSRRSVLARFLGDCDFWCIWRVLSCRDVDILLTDGRLSRAC